MTTEKEITEETPEEKTAPAEKRRRGIFKIMPVWSFVFFTVALAAGAIHAALYLSPRFADAFNGTVSAGFRFVLAKITSVYPASLAELVLLSAPVILFLVLRGIWRYMGYAKHGFIRSLCAVLSVAAVMYSLFVFDFAAGYRTTKLPERMGLTVEKTEPETLYSVTSTVIERLNAEVSDVSFRDGGASVAPYSHGELVSKLTESYDGVCAEYPFIKNFKAPVKRLVVSPIMTYTHISGVFSFYTGEANLNTNYPDFVNVFSTAHEMAHQRGIARENEANFVAYLVLIRSDDPYLRYCGYLNMYEYLSDPLWSADKDLYTKAASSLDPAVRLELKAYSAFFEKYRDSTASKVAETVNNGYLVIQGTEGVRSYGMVADLAIAYHRAGG
ncbi:MAG: DUF3810 domain-containing protein [Clostridia bacterium]|nr:DUF3810 domain-containing protein [Clostridia bacterium]